MHRAVAAFDRALDRYGERVILRRTNAAPAPPTDATVRARITGFTPEELASGVMQGNRKCLVSATDVAASGFPLPIRKGGVDAIVARGTKMTIQSVDDSTSRVGPDLVCYIMGITG